ncbi:hypothetical protein BDZ45DRAFT_750784 [Acephala macrosclerotiorum]|nr:hypothetical protein BDZ45DRAFT_750784 [Acephala macrosclerotiorum]
MTASEESQETSYVLHSNKAATESERPDLQHRFISSFTPEGFIFPSIPEENSFASPTIWLRVVLAALPDAPTSNSKSRTYTGFDISSSFFPSKPEPGLQFVEHDILRPFPAEQIGKYSLVRVRLLAAALKADQILIAPQVSLASEKPETRKRHQSLIDFGKKLGFVENIQEVLNKVFQRKEIRLTDVRKQTYHGEETLTDETKRDMGKTRKMIRTW